MKITKQGLITKIISGGQTGVDRAALDVAIALGFEYGGFCPRGRLAEDGVIPDKYNLRELKSSKYLKRTHKNVKMSDGSLILHSGIVFGGTLKTIEYCQIQNKPFITINLLDNLNQIQVNFNHWMIENNITILNVAGPRESEETVYNKTFSLLIELL